LLGLAAFNLWWSFKEFILDRFGIWRFLPDYKFGRLCVWDLTVAVLIIGVVIVAILQKEEGGERG
jgi:membrane protease YdiL (CAAX protease family)